MAKDNRETEIKLRIDSPENMVKKLRDAGAREVELLEQEDIIWDYAFGDKSFKDKKQSFRLRLQKGRNETRTILTFKKSSKIDASGIKTRDEYNILVGDFNGMRDTLENIGFRQDLVVKKRRRVFKLNGLEVTLDELPFGNFVEIEGETKDIKKVIKKLGLENLKAETRPYFIIQREWQEKK